MVSALTCTVPSLVGPMSNTLVSSMLMMVKRMTFLTEDNEELTKITMELLVMVTVIAMEQ